MDNITKFLLTFIIVVVVAVHVSAVVILIWRCTYSPSLTSASNGSFNSENDSQSEPTKTEAAKTSLTPTQEYIKAVVGGAGSLLGALIGGLISFLVFWKGLRANTRNAFLDMVVSENAYRNQLDEFLKALNKGDINKIKENLNSPALIILLIRKPNLKNKLDAAINTSNIIKVREVTKKLFAG